MRNLQKEWKDQYWVSSSCLLFAILSIINKFQIQMFNLPSGSDLQSHIEKSIMLDDPRVFGHVSSILKSLKNEKNQADIVHHSNLVKQSTPVPNEMPMPLPMKISMKEYPQQKGPNQYFTNFCERDFDRLKWAGICLGQQLNYIIANEIKTVAKDNNAHEIRFWGKIMGTQHDYYVLQGKTDPMQTINPVPKSQEKDGQGANYYKFWVTTNLHMPKWQELPLITTHHLKTSRQIKAMFTGDLNHQINCCPLFDGLEKHYLKAQLVRMTSSLEITPKGLIKVNEDNPKLVELEEEPKLPEWGQMSTLQGWVHRNTNILQLGRCTHYVDPTLSEEQIEATTAELAEKDPEIERLRAITEDKTPEGNAMGIENIWQVKISGDKQIISKEETQFSYGVVVLRNIYWPGWTTIGYKTGFTNFYCGFGHKSIQSAWNNYTNQDLAEQGDGEEECHEPNPKEEPKPQEEKKQGEEENNQEAE